MHKRNELIITFLPVAAINVSTQYPKNVCRKKNENLYLSTYTLKLQTSTFQCLMFEADVLNEI